MNFDFSDDQKMLQEQVRKFLADKSPFKTTRRVLESDEAYADEVWKGLVELGVTAATIPEEYGGAGMGALELCVVAEELGRACAAVPAWVRWSSASLPRSWAAPVPPCPSPRRSISPPRR